MKVDHLVDSTNGITLEQKMRVEDAGVCLNQIIDFENSVWKTKIYYNNC